MITEDKLHHIIGVARKCYKISQLCGESENFCRKMFMIGWMHDVGYEYNPESHAAISKEMFLSCLNPATQAINDFSNTSNAIEFHGYVPEVLTKEWMILNQADLTIDHTGKEVSVMERLQSIRERHGEVAYFNARDVAMQVGLL